MSLNVAKVLSRFNVFVPSCRILKWRNIENNEKKMKIFYGRHLKRQLKKFCINMNNIIFRPMYFIPVLSRHVLFWNTNDTRKFLFYVKRLTNHFTGIGYIYIYLKIIMLDYIYYRKNFIGSGDIETSINIWSVIIFFVLLKYQLF